MNSRKAIILAYESLVMVTSHPPSTIKRSDYIIGDIYPYREIPFSTNTFLDRFFESIWNLYNIPQGFDDFMSDVLEDLDLQEESQKWPIIRTVDDYINFIDIIFTYRDRRKVVRAFNLAMRSASKSQTYQEVMNVKREVRQCFSMTESKRIEHIWFLRFI